MGPPVPANPPSRSCSRVGSAIACSTPARSIARSRCCPIATAPRGPPAPRSPAIALALDIRFEIVGDANRVYLGGEDVSADIRTPHISQGASQVSAHPEVRAALLELQRRLGAGGGVVVEGRDTGTVVFPRAQAKFFLTATVQERARRRVAELTAAGHDRSTTSGPSARFAERDQRDASRDVAPMVPAADAVIVDSSTQTLEQVVDSLAAQVEPAPAPAERFAPNDSSAARRGFRVGYVVDKAFAGGT